jgi:hypothetical protein
MRLPIQTVATERFNDYARATATRAGSETGIGMSGVPCPVCDIGYQICKDNGGGIACDIAYQVCRANCN